MENAVGNLDDVNTPPASEPGRGEQDGLWGKKMGSSLN